MEAMRPSPPPEPQSSGLKPEDIEVVAPNFKRRLSGVTATIQRLVPLQARVLGIVALGPGLGQRVPRIPVSMLASLTTRPRRRPFRIWHARRNTEMLAGLVLRDVFRLARPSTVVMHGIDTELFHPATDPCDAWEATGLPGRIGIGCFGRIRHQKGTDVFVDAMIRLLPTFPDATAIILGRATDQHAGFERDLKVRVKAAGLDRRILFLGEVGVDEIATWYRRLGIFVAPQRWEGFGLTPLEAMASGVPVIATTVGAFPELIVDGQTGCLVPPGDVDALVAAAQSLLDNALQRQAFGLAARDRVLTHFSLEREAAAVTAVYESLWRRDG
jgi:mannosyltransferase